MFARTRRFFKRRSDRLVDTTAKVVNYQEIKSHGSFILTMLRQIRAQPTQVREETFRSAYRRLDLTEAKLAQAHRYHLTRFYIFACFGSLALGGLLYSLVRLNWFSLGPSLGALALMGALAFQASFRLFQIERRELVSPRQWLASPGSWVPAPFEAQAEPSRRVGGGD